MNQTTSPRLLQKRGIKNLLTDAFVVFFIAAIALSLLGIQPAHAASVPAGAYVAEKVMGSSHVAMRPGERRTVTFGFKNTGTQTWRQGGGQWVSLYTYDPKYHRSVFEDASWENSLQPVRLMESEVRPGGVGHFEFVLKAPAVPGQYYETFHLAAEDAAWIEGGVLALNIPVSADNPLPAEQASSSTQAPQADGLSALLLLRSEKSVVARAGQAVTYKVGIKNSGNVTWKKMEVKTPSVQIASTSPNTSHASWVNTSTLLALNDTAVEPGALEFFEFTFTAPRQKGSYDLRYTFSANGTEIPDFYIDIPVEVTSNAPEVINDPVIRETSDMIEEPTIRVGALIVDEETDWEVEVSCAEDWELRSGSGGLLAQMKANESALAYFQKDELKYYFNRGKGLEKTSDFLRFVPSVPNSVCTIENFDRRVTRNFSHADNTFRNVLELRYNTAKDRTWMINEIPIEYYLRGLAETSNISHYEFQKTLITVARTYALYHWERGTKRGPEHFTITAYSDDQVYGGYGREARSPNIVKAVEETRGRVVTYDGKTAITPYFSRSDGRTRDWSEVWFGEVEWAKSVPVPCDEGKTLWGHGVGLSASGALCMANNGEKWNDILNYFYTGIELNRHWN